MPTTKLRHIMTTAPLLRPFFFGVSTVSLIRSASVSGELDDGDRIEQHAKACQHEAERDVAIAARLALRFGQFDGFDQIKPPAWNTRIEATRSNMRAEKMAN